MIALNGENETTFKQLLKDGGELLLKPLNLRDPIRPLGGARVIGVVREFTKRFRQTTMLASFTHMPLFGARAFWSRRSMRDRMSI